MNQHPAFHEVATLIQGYANIPFEEIADCLSTATIKEFKKGQAFVTAGEKSQSVGFVSRGLFKTYCITPEGHSYVRGFYPQGYFVGAYASAILGAPADMTVEAIEPSTVLVTDYTRLESFFSRSIAWQSFARKLTERHFIVREMKEFRLLACSALERYDFFVAENSELISRLSQADIASYIGVAPESLSRALKNRK